MKRTSETRKGYENGYKDEEGNVVPLIRFNHSVSAGPR